MLRIISLFLLLIISRVSFAETISASSVKYYYYDSISVHGSYSTPAEVCSNLAVYLQSTSTSGRSYKVDSNYATSETTCYLNYKTATSSTWSSSVLSYLISNYIGYLCSSGYTQSDSAGNADSSGHYCTKNSCQDLYQTTSMIDIPPRQTVTNACFNGCSATSMLGTWVCDSDTACSVRVQFDGNSCSGGVDYAANASSSDSGSEPDSPPPCSTGSTSGTVNGETVTTCADDGTDSPPITDTPSSSTPTTTSGAGSTVGNPENTSGTQNSTVGGGSDSLGGEGYGEGGSAGSSSGSDSGSTSSGSDSGSTSGSGTDSGGTSSGGSDSGSTSGSGTDSGGTSSGGADSGSTSGSGSGSDTGTGTATSGAGDTDSDTPDTEEEEESGDGGGSFSEPAEGKDYFSELFGTADLQALADKKTAIEESISTKKSEIKGLFEFTGISMSGSLSENTQEIKGASIDLSGKSTFDRFTYIAAILYFAAIIIAIWIVLGGKK